MTPIVRWKNFTLENLKEVLSYYKDEYFGKTWKKAEDLIEEENKGYKRTSYQYCGQLGLEYKEGKKLNLFTIQDYLLDFSDDNLKKYLTFWFLTYYAPNIRVSGEEEPTLIYVELINEILKKEKLRLKEEEFKLFANGSDDILRNCYISLGQYINYNKENKEFFIKEEEKEKVIELKKMIERYFPIPLDYNSQKEFFERYKKKNFELFYSKINEVKKPYNRIIYGAPGTGKSYKLNKEIEEAFPILKKVAEIKEINKDINYWVVGSSWSDGDQTNRFIKDNIWENGYDDKFLEKVRSVEVGDLIAIKSTFTRKNKDNKYIAVMRVKAIGRVTENDGSGLKLGIEWLNTNKKDYDNISYRLTIHSVWDKHLNIFENFLNEQVISEETYKISTVERVTFYDGYTHGQFVGTYKPVSKEGEISYDYVPGPLMRQLVKAYKNPSDNFCLVIEEINRARADKVFGNIFQLLDRDQEGKSQYPVALSEDQIAYFIEELEDEDLNVLDDLINNGLYLPNNLYIWATMNSADQGVYPLDSAFKRRWSFEHISLYDKDSNEFFEKNKIIYNVIYGKNEDVKWNKFRKVINNQLLENKVPEDRLMAPFFINPDNFKVKDNLERELVLDEQIFTDKVLMYLFEDILRHKSNSILFEEGINSFSQLKEEHKKGNPIFNELIIEKLKDKSEDQSNES